jgi:5,10-methylenetetrahydrofolate reductase
MSRLSERFGKERLITSEISLPRGPDTARFMSEIAEYKKVMKRLHAVNVVDNPGAMLLMGSLPASIMLKQNGIEPIYQVTGRDRNQLGIQADLIGAAAFGIQNVLALTGDPPTCESSDHPRAKGVFDLNSITLINTLREMNAGKDHAGGKLNKATDFFVGAAIAPGSRSLDAEIKKTEKKFHAGVDFFQTQVVFEQETLAHFFARYELLTEEDIRKKVLVGVLPLYSVGMIKFLRRIPGIFISEKIERRIKDAKDPLEEGVNICAEVIDSTKILGIAGVHIMPAGKPEGLFKVLERI